MGRGGNGTPCTDCPERMTWTFSGHCFSGTWNSRSSSSRFRCVKNDSALSFWKSKAACTSASRAGSVFATGHVLQRIQPRQRLMHPAQQCLDLVLQLRDRRMHRLMMLIQFLDGVRVAVD